LTINEPGSIFLFVVRKQMMLHVNFISRKCQKSCEQDDLVGGGLGGASIVTQIFACALLDEFFRGLFRHETAIEKYGGECLHVIVR